MVTHSIQISSRREFLCTIAGGLLIGSSTTLGSQQGGSTDTRSRGSIDGHPVARQVGLKVFADGGNAIDATVAAALTAAVVAPYQCGIAGYGGHMTIASAGQKKVVSIDFNTAAPASASPDMFPTDDDGSVKGSVNQYGWLASGVPGTLAGLQLSLDRYGSRPLGELMQPAIQYSRDGIIVDRWLAIRCKQSAPQLARDPAAARLYLPGGKPLEQGDRLKNPETAELLQSLADRGTVDSFYRGDVAQQIADAFKAGGGLVTARDMAAYRAREVEPITLSWGGHTICTAPLTAGGTTVLETLSFFRELGEAVNATTDKGVHGWVEALRVAWDDRLRLLGDPWFTEVPVERLLSRDYAKQWAARVTKAVEQEQKLQIKSRPRNQDGTIHLSAADGDGNLVALTLTHGAAFGSHVVVDGLGILLGAGMSRFDPRADHPNSPAPGKRPLHNMCPTIVLRDDRPILAIGGAGGRRIPNAVTSVLCNYIGRETTIAKAVAGPRIHNEGNDDVWFNGPVADSAAVYLKQIGYRIGHNKIALVSAATRDPDDGGTASASG